ncbi:MAG: WecB/TagA/CpsF family glycosyltransferase [Lactobacillus sp.]|nr:WecB/TagA/CpsF family glycosyltransferase [Lactobacillus sp.]MDN6042850.1 WecB/TagA/CpsF family glycosyltransferase [Lactobacillus sp.]MDN6052531.1 WecB/TagA/CpsF family glycosyltransferase [Lactobacillus sp.]
MKKVNVLGVNFDNLTTNQFKSVFQARLAEHESTFIVTGNPEIVMAAQENPEYLKILQEQADYITPDGIGIIKASQWLKQPLQERVTGYDLFTWFMRLAAKKQLRVYLIGARLSVIREVQAKIEREYRGIQLVGAEDGYFKDDLDLVARRIKKTKPDLVFAALGFPRQDQLIARLRQLETPAVMMGVGGSFDVFSGTVKRAPEIFQRLRVEWLYRLLTNPTRLGRMLVLPKFVVRVKHARKKS